MKEISREELDKKIENGFSKIMDCFNKSLIESSKRKHENDKLIDTLQDTIRIFTHIRKIIYQKQGLMGGNTKVVAYIDSFLDLIMQTADNFLDGKKVNTQILEEANSVIRVINHYYQFGHKTERFN